MPGCASVPANAADPIYSEIMPKLDPVKLDPADREPTLPRLRLWSWWLIVTAVGLLLFSYRHLGNLAVGVDQSFIYPLVNEMVAAYGGGLLFFPVRWLVRRFPPIGRRWSRHLVIHGVAILLYGLVHTSWMWGVRTLIYQWLDLGPFDYGAMPLRYFMELPFQAIGYAFFAACIVLVDQLSERRRQELQSARLESRLATAQVHNLRRQLQPHFLFNTLNTISATLYDDPDAADEMIDHLATLLRYSLQIAEKDEVSLREELSILGAYQAILKARFGDRLTIRFAVDPSLEACRVPSMILQPLRHGGVEGRGQGIVDIRAFAESEDRWVLEVEDDGPGFAGEGDPVGFGVGLSTTAERLALLYGKHQRFTAGSSESGFKVRVELPTRPMAVEEPAGD